MIDLPRRSHTYSPVLGRIAAQECACAPERTFVSIDSRPGNNEGRLGSSPGGLRCAIALKDSA
jgi:hypothetical protein